MMAAMQEVNMALCKGVCSLVVDAVRAKCKDTKCERCGLTLCGRAQEAGMMAAMRHPNIVLYLGVCSDPPCVVTEYCARGSLNDVFKRALLNPLYAAHLDWCKRCAPGLMQFCLLAVCHSTLVMPLAQDAHHK